MAHPDVVDEENDGQIWRALKKNYLETDIGWSSSLGIMWELTIRY
jgi:hypothetical protein